MVLRPDSAPMLIPYPERFEVAVQFVSKHVSQETASDEQLLLFYSLYQQATEGPCKLPKPWVWDTVPRAKWEAWSQLGDMIKMEAMRLYVRSIEEDFTTEWVDWCVEYRNKEEGKQEEVEANPLASSSQPTGATPIVQPINSVPVAVSKRQSLDDVCSRTSVGREEWVCPVPVGSVPMGRSKHSMCVVGERVLVVFGGHKSRFLDDLHLLDIETMEWFQPQCNGSVAPEPRAAHTACGLPNGREMVVFGGYGQGKPLNDLYVFDTVINEWRVPNISGTVPSVRGGHTAAMVGSRMYIFGGEGHNGELNNEVHVLDTDRWEWSRVEPTGTPPSPRREHVMLPVGERLVVFGGAESTRYSGEVFVLETGSLTWSQPIVNGAIPSPRAGMAGTSVGTSIMIVGGGDGQRGYGDIHIMDTNTMVWFRHAVVGLGEKELAKSKSPLESGIEPILQYEKTTLTAREGLAASVVRGQFVILFGGYDGLTARNDMFMRHLRGLVRSEAAEKQLDITESYERKIRDLERALNHERQEKESVEGELGQAILRVNKLQRDIKEEAEAHRETRLRMQGEIDSLKEQMENWSWGKWIFGDGPSRETDKSAVRQHFR